MIINKHRDSHKFYAEIEFKNVPPEEIADLVSMIHESSSFHMGWYIDGYDVMKPSDYGVDEGTVIVSVVLSGDRYLTFYHAKKMINENYLEFSGLKEFYYDVTISIM